MTLPTYFIPHGGGPCFFMDWSITGDPADTWNRTADWLRGLSGTLPMRPKAIVVISGHWEETAFTAASIESPGLIYDYTGFPPHTYKLQYPAPGAPWLARRLVELLSQAGLPAKLDSARGFDHGIFIPFLLFYPQADIPIVPLYFAKEREVVLRGGSIVPIYSQNDLLPGERSERVMCRMRSLGCMPCTGAIRSEADTLPKIIQELLGFRRSERENRAIDHDEEGSMEVKKREGYF